MRLVTYYEFEILGELLLHVGYDYEEGQPLIMYPVEDAQEGLAAGVSISSIEIVQGSNRIKVDVDEGEFVAHLEEECLADYEEHMINARDEYADQQNQLRKDERI